MMRKTVDIELTFKVSLDVDSRAPLDSMVWRCKRLFETSDGRQSLHAEILLEAFNRMGMSLAAESDFDTKCVIADKYPATRQQGYKLRLATEACVAQGARSYVHGSVTERDGKKRLDVVLFKEEGYR